MPSKNEVKTYLPDCIYHIYNRGVEKRIIFLDKQDYSTFLSYLKTYLEPKDEDDLLKKLSSDKIDPREKDKILKILHLNNFSNSISLLAYCLMPNHYHLLIHQTVQNLIQKFMNSLITRYSMYFNKKYKRVGPLFQGVYKAVIVDDDEQLVHTSRYIHLQAIYDSKRRLFSHPQPSSYPNYLGQISQMWMKPNRILSLFNTSKLISFNQQKFYKSFVEDLDIDLQGLPLEARNHI